MNDLLGALERLNARMEILERRVCALEHPSETDALPAQPILASGAPAEADTLPQASGIFPVAGKSLLGIAGAYLLRAVAESGSFPKMAVVGLALAYAAMWLVWAARVSPRSFASTSYAATAALILAPMLWELTLVFNVLSATATASLLVAFVATATALAWRHSLASVVWVASVTAAVTALALSIATHDLVPFTMALLVIALVTEVAACCDRWRSLRPVVAAPADLAIGILAYIYSRPENGRAEYPAVETRTLLALVSILFLTYAASTAYRTIWRQQRITVFEIGQTVIAFSIAVFSVLAFGPGSSAQVLGVLCLLLSAGCYAAAFLRFDRTPEQRTYHVFTTWSAGLFLTGSFLCLPPLPLALALSVTAVLATFIGARASRLALEFHGLVYLTAAALASGLLDYGGRALGGTFPSAPGWMVWIAAGSAIVCYAIDGGFRGELWSHRMVQLLSAGLAVSAVATFLVSVLVWLTESGLTPAIHHVAVIRTLITCALALALAFSGARWQRVELVWLAYGTLACVTVKLLLEDLRHGHPGSVAVSIFFYAVALIAIPQMSRLGRSKV
jgi:hypothetical protein